MFKIIGRQIQLPKIRQFVMSLSSIPSTALSEQTHNAKIVSVEGNIGAGKTTLANRIGKALDYKVFYEPVNQNPYLAKFYDNPKKYAFKLQCWIYRQRFLIYCNALQHYLSSGQGVILDRSVYSDTVFANTGNKDGMISPSDYDCYQLLRQNSLDWVIPPDVIIYLQVSPQNCLERIRKRNRSYERNISVSYLQKLEDEFKIFINDMRRWNVSVCCYDWSKYGNVDEVISGMQQNNSTTKITKDLSKIKKFIFNQEKVLALLYPDKSSSHNDEIDQYEEFKYWLREQAQ